MNTYELTQYPVDFHILGNPTNNLGYLWYSAGSYVNDDGINPALLGNYNHYAISSYMNANDGGLYTIGVTFTQYYTAYNFDGEVAPGCSAVNMNDFLGTIYIYYVAEQTFDFTYTVTVNYNNGNKATTGTATFDALSDRLIFTPSAPICMTNIANIVYVQN